MPNTFSSIKNCFPECPNISLLYKSSTNEIASSIFSVTSTPFPEAKPSAFITYPFFELLDFKSLIAISGLE